MNADGPAPKVLLADKGYDADFIREDMRGTKAGNTIRQNRNLGRGIQAGHRRSSRPGDAALRKANFLRHSVKMNVWKLWSDAQQGAKDGFVSERRIGMRLIADGRLVQNCVRKADVPIATENAVALSGSRFRCGLHSGTTSPKVSSEPRWRNETSLREIPH